eukprot:m.1040258 g.1040258  ORF g.1040258 m.1040258 type:complete len:64 (-) comp24154_c0_seq19:1504-1695(-)
MGIPCGADNTTTVSNIALCFLCCITSISHMLDTKNFTPRPLVPLRWNFADSGRQIRTYLRLTH